MSLTLKPYPEYKESGDSWLGLVPRSWEARSLGSLLKPRNERNSPDLPLLSVVREKGVILRSSMTDEENHNFVPDDLSNYKVVREGDLVINKMKAWQGSLGIAPCDGVVSPAYFVFRLGIPNRAFAETVLRSKSYIPFFAQASDGVRIGQWDLSPEKMKRIPLFLPSDEEQDAIVRFLSRANLAIKKLIRAKRRVIQMLKEQKLASAETLVIQGLDENVRLSPSPAPWNAMPHHWRILRAKYLFREVDDRSTAGDETHLSMTQRFGLVPSGDMRERRLLSESYAGGKLCRKGDLVLNRLKAHLGVFAVAPQDGVVSPDYSIFRPNQGVNVDYFAFVLRSPACRVELRKRAKGIVQGFWRLYTDDFYDIKLPVPPSNEQLWIVEAAERATADLTAQIDRISREIELLHEYRTRLIADVVTGKLDVRGVELPEIEEVEEPDIAEEIDSQEELVAAEGADDGID